MDKYEILRKFFGHKTFRSAQEEIIDNILAGRDCLCVMPTGAGKSLCFQVPALMLPGTTLVISPLISLMRDQVNQLAENGVRAACINSSLETEEFFLINAAAAAGELKILYVAPERLLSEGFLELCSRLDIRLVAVDEAHCVSHWGQDFRPSYLKIPEFIGKLKNRPALAAFTATATQTVKEDIEQLLELKEPYSVTTGFDRPNLFLAVRNTKKDEPKDAQLLDIIGNNSGSAIVYCATRKNAENTAALLVRNGINAAAYHAGLSAESRKAAQDGFINDKIDVICATNAFGMGIDKSNVALVVHYNMPKDLESYYQEAGRAGRDGSPARCILLFSKQDIMLARFMIENSRDEGDFSDTERQELERRDRSRLQKMIKYCETTDCLRREILGYFGENTDKTGGKCGNCSNCTRDFETADVTVEAQKILSCIFRLKQRGCAENKTVLCRILNGSRDARIMQKNYQTLSTYGIMKNYHRGKITEIIDYLQREDYFECAVNSSGEEICVLTPKADDFVKNRARITMQFRKEDNILPKKEERPGAELFERLKALRKKTAETLGVPPYVIFSDATLWDMCAKLPKTTDDFLQVSGVGLRKAERYGNKFLKEIKKYSGEVLKL